MGHVASGFGEGRVVLNGSRNQVRPIPASSRARSPSNAYTPQVSTSFGAAADSLNVARFTPKPDMDGYRAGGDAKLDGMCLSATMPAPSGMNHAAQHLGIRHDMDDTANKSSTSFDDDQKDGNDGMRSNQLLHKCENCAKVYRHPSCLVKHRWEHTMYWKEASKFLMSKHQQVQLLEAAAILVGMDSNARSLPEEKALWPAAVSPPSSGLLGCDQVNFDKLMASKMRNQVPFYTEFAYPYGTSAPAQSLNCMPDTRHNIYRRAGAHADIDEEESAIGDDSAELDVPPREDSFGYNTGGDMMADMEMEAE